MDSTTRYLVATLALAGGLLCGGLALVWLLAGQAPGPGRLALWIERAWTAQHYPLQFWGIIVGLASGAAGCAWVAARALRKATATAVRGEGPP